MAPWDVYAESLAYLGYGYPVWYPDTWSREKPWEMKIGDVGWLKDGQFRPLIRTTATNEAQQPYGRAPAEFVPFNLDSAGTGGHPDKIMQRVLHSRKIETTSMSAGLSASVSNPLELNVDGNITFKCTEDRAGLLVLSPRGEETSIDSATCITDYLRANHKKWENFANNRPREGGLGLGLDPEDIIFVSGVVKTVNWGVAAFTSGQHETSGSLSCSFGGIGSASISLSVTDLSAGNHWARVGPPAQWRAERDRQLSDISTTSNISLAAASSALPFTGPSLRISDTSSPDPSSYPWRASVSTPHTPLSAAHSLEPGSSPGYQAPSTLHAPPPRADQCIFFHYYKLKPRGILTRVLPLQFQLKAGAGPHELPRDPGGPGGESGVLADIMDIAENEEAAEFDMIPSTDPQHFDPVNAALDYILENSDAQIAIASDMDLYTLFEHQEYPRNIVRALAVREPRVVVDDAGVGVLEGGIMLRVDPEERKLAAQLSHQAIRTRSVDPEERKLAAQLSHQAIRTRSADTDARDFMATWAVLDVSADPANAPRDSSKCHLLPQEAVQDANEALEGDVYFYTISGVGITLAQALQGQTDDLKDRDKPAFKDGTVTSTKITMRIQIQDRKPYHNRQVTVLRVLRVATEPVTLGKLAEKIAQETQKYLADKLPLKMDGRDLPFEEIFLWRLRRATKASWQPEFYVRLSGQA